MVAFLEEISDEEIMKINHGRVFVVYSTDWCAPCNDFYQMLSKHQKEIERLFKEKGISAGLKVDIDKAPQIAAEHGVRVQPVWAVYDEGKPIGIGTGKTEYERFESRIRSLGLRNVAEQ